MTFANHHRQAVIEANPELGMSKTAVILGAMWRELSEDSKDTYRKEAQDEFDKAKLEARKACPATTRKNKTKPKRPKDAPNVS